MTTIHEIAKLSGYSVSTVSRVLNQHPYVSEEKRTKIQAIINELGYKPNTVARNLSLGKTNTIGVLMPYNNQPYFDTVLNGIIQQAFQQGCKVALLPTNYDKEIEKEYLEELRTGAFDGIIVLSKANDLTTFAPYKKQLVFCEKIEETSFSSIFIDRKAIYLEVFQQLKKAGVTEVGLTVNRWQDKSSNTKKMIEAYQQVFGALKPNRIARHCRTIEDGRRVAQQFLKEDTAIQAVVTNGDEVAAGIQQVAGQQIIVIGQENTLLSEMLAFSTIHHPLVELGQGAMKLIQEQQPQQICLTSTLIKREKRLG